MSLSSHVIWAGKEPMGLFWSLEPAPGQKEGVRLLKRDVTVPLRILVSVIDNHVEAKSQEHHEGGNVLAQVTLERTYMDTGVQRIPVREGKIRGTLFLPPGEGPFPGVIDTFGIIGGLVEIRASLLASRGFASLALAYCNYEDLPKATEYIPLEYFEEAIHWFTGHPKVLEGGIGTVGVSKGGEVACYMAVLSEKVNAVISIAGAFYPTLPSHSFRGRKIPVGQFDFEKVTLEGDGIVTAGALPKTPEQVPECIPVEKAKSAHFLHIHGSDDKMMPPELRHGVSNLLQAHGKSNSKVLFYRGAGHLIEPPYAPLCKKTFYKIFGNMCLTGGNTKDHATAQEHSWEQILLFLRSHLPQGSITTIQKSKL